MPHSPNIPQVIPIVNNEIITANVFIHLFLILAKTNTRIMPIIAIITGNLVKSPKATKVAGSETTIPAFFKPIKVIKKPIPAPIANFKFLGIAFKIHFLKGVTEIIIKITPLINVKAKASG